MECLQKWFDDLSYDEFQQIWSNPRLRDVLEKRIVILVDYMNGYWLVELINLNNGQNTILKMEF